MSGLSPWELYTGRRDGCGHHLWRDLPWKDEGRRPPDMLDLGRLREGTNCLRFRRRLVMNLRVRRVAPSSD